MGTWRRGVEKRIGSIGRSSTFTVGDRNAWTTVFNPMTPGVPQPSTGGRKPGMINVNTIWAQEVLNALADPQQQANFFQQSDVDNTWNAIQRNHRLFAFKHSGNDTPYLSFAHTGPVDPTQPPTPAFPTTAGVGGTVLNGDFHGPTGADDEPVHHAGNAAQNRQQYDDCAAIHSPSISPSDSLK